MANGLSRRQAERATMQVPTRLTLLEGEMDDVEGRFDKWDRKLTTVLVLVAGVFTELLVGLIIFVMTR